MKQIFGSCNRYVQGFKEIKNLKDHVAWMGTRFLVIASKNRLSDLRDTIKESLMGLEVEFVQFDGQCSWKTVNEITEAATGFKADAVIGLGGGKVADTAKVVADKVKAHIVIIPTISASDASTSSVSLVYREDGTIEDVLPFPKSPDLVLADTAILIKAPVRLFVSGMGDALSTYVGGKVCKDNYYDNHFQGKGTETALAIAKLSYDMLLQYGLQAKIAAERKVITHAFNAVTEVNILMSGLGFENNGSSADHCFYFGTLALKEREEYVYHGEGVAFSTCCQLVMQGASNEELDEVYGFCSDVGLPVTFDDMGLPNLTEEEFEIMTNAALSEIFMHNQPFEVTYEKVYGAYKAADALGHLYKNGGKLV